MQRGSTVKRVRHLSRRPDRCAIAGLVAVMAVSWFAGAVRAAGEEALAAEAWRDESTISVGSGALYRTQVESHTQGALSAPDLHQASLLTSRIVGHLNQAVEGLLDQNPERARLAIEQARRLISVVRALLPVTTVTTVVKDAAGTEVYQDVDRIQNDRIPLYSGMIAMEVVEPVIEAKGEAAELKGVRLADADVIYTSVLVDLRYLERKLERATALFDTPDAALAQLLLGQTQGIQLTVNAADDPLVKVQQALRLAERLVEEGKYEVARDNLGFARLQLGTYRALLGKEDAAVVQKLEDEITALMPKTRDSGAAAAIRTFWERTLSLFGEESRQARVFEEEPTPGKAAAPAGGEDPHRGEPGDKAPAREKGDAPAAQ